MAKYISHQHLKLKDLPLNPKTMLHVISMLNNGQSYTLIQKYIYKNLGKDMLKSTISNLRRKVVTARSLNVPITDLLDGRTAKGKSVKAKYISPNDCVNALIRSYYSDVKSQTLTDNQRKAFIKVLKMKLKYHNELKDSDITDNVIDTALSHDYYTTKALATTLLKYAKLLGVSVDTVNKDITRNYQSDMDIVSKDDIAKVEDYAKRHNIKWSPLYIK